MACVFGLLSDKIIFNHVGNHILQGLLLEQQAALSCTLWFTQFKFSVWTYWHLNVSLSSAALEGAVTLLHRVNFQLVAGSESRLTEERHAGLFGFPCDTDFVFEITDKASLTRTLPVSASQQPWAKKARKRRRWRGRRRQPPRWRKRFQRGPNERR